MSIDELLTEIATRADMIKITNHSGQFYVSIERGANEHIRATDSNLTNCIKHTYSIVSQWDKKP